MTDRHGNDFDFSKDLDINVDVDIDLDVDVDVDIDKDVNICIDINQDLYIDGNTAELNLDAEAIGDNSLVEVDAVVLTTDHSSSVVLHVISAVD